MNPINNLIDIFCIKKENVNDNLMNTNITQKIDFNQLPKYDDIIKVIKEFDVRDKIEIYLVDESDESIILYSNNLMQQSEYDQFLKSNESLNSNITINIKITKKIESLKISIFDINSFLSNFLKNSILNNLKFINSRFKMNSQIVFVNYDNDYNFNTKSIIMINNNSDINIVDINRKEIIERCNSVSNFANNIEYSLIPEDFSMMTANIDSSFIERFQKIKILFSLIYIVDYACFDEKDLKLKLNGYRNKDYLINLDKFHFEDRYNEFFKIYSWIFQDGNEFDKVSLTRNVISMYCKYSDILDIDERTFLSIKSNYNIYLKENVDKYIELKNKLTEFISTTAVQINNIMDNFVDSFKKNIGAFITFLLGTFIANLVSDRPLDNILTVDIIKILIFILFGSLIYLIMSIFEGYFKFKSYKRNYFNLKESYKDILNINDINIIFKNDEEYLNNKKEIVKIISIFSLLWIFLIIGILWGIAIYGKSELLNNIIEIILLILKCDIT